jgi:hypothetical protein
MCDPVTLEQETCGTCALDGKQGGRSCARLHDAGAQLGFGEDMSLKVRHTLTLGERW